MTAGETSAMGGCLCGAIRYACDSDPQMTGYCHCRMCQKALGSPFGAALIYNKNQVRILSGELVWHRSSDAVRRGFCGNCGSPLLYERLDTDDLVVRVGTLDDPDRFAPENHWWTDTRIAWGDVHPELSDETEKLQSHTVATIVAAEKRQNN